MWRERALKIVLVVVGLFFLAGLYPVTTSLWHASQDMYTDDMMISLYIALGVFLLMAARNPAEHRSLITFTAWSSFAHGAVMTVMAYQKVDERQLLWGVGILAVIGVTLLALAPAKPGGAETPRSP